MFVAGTADSQKRATETVVLPPKVKSRLESLRSIPEEPLWRVVVRALDSLEQKAEVATVGAG